MHIQYRYRARPRYGWSGGASDLRGSLRARYGDEAGGAHFVRALERGDGRGGPGALAEFAAPAFYATRAATAAHQLSCYLLYLNIVI